MARPEQPPQQQVRRNSCTMPIFFQCSTCVERMLVVQDIKRQLEPDTAAAAARPSTPVAAARPLPAAAAAGAAAQPPIRATAAAEAAPPPVSTAVSKRHRSDSSSVSPPPTPRVTRREPHVHTFEVVFKKIEVKLELKLHELNPKMRQLAGGTYTEIAAEKHDENMLRVAIAVLFPVLKSFRNVWNKIKSIDVDGALYTWANKPGNFPAVIKRLRKESDQRKSQFEGPNDWWTDFVDGCLIELNNGMVLLAPPGILSQPISRLSSTGFRAICCDKTMGSRRQVEQRGKLRVRVAYRKGCFAMARAQRREDRRTAPARAVTSQASIQGIDRARKHTMDHTGARARKIGNHTPCPCPTCPTCCTCLPCPQWCR